MRPMRKSVLFIDLAVGTALMMVLALRHVLGEGLDETRNTPSYRSASSTVCGRFGDKLMRIDPRYLFLSRVEYQDVDYWTPGNRKAHDSKGCEDQIQSAAFDVQWPDMTPSNSFKNMGKPDFVRIALKQRSVWRAEEQGESKDFFDAAERLLTYLSHTDAFKLGDRKSFSEINKIKAFNHNLGFYEITPYDNESSKTVVFWREVEGKGVSLTVKCLYFKKRDDPSCELTDHVPNYGAYTSYLKIRFHADLLPRWQELHHEALQLIDRFTVQGNMQ